MDTCCSAPHRFSSSSVLEWKFIWAFVLNGGLAAMELAMSIVTGSTAVLADGLMNVDDLAALGFSIYTEKGSWYLFLLFAEVVGSALHV